MNFDQQLKAYTERANRIIDAYLPKEEGRQKDLCEAMNYSIHVGGKRLRPILMILAYEMCGGTGSAVEPFAAAMEMIHTHSLIHDDLPALDNDTLRRGKPTTHVAYGESAAILAGDALLNHAYVTMASAATQGTDPAAALRALGIIANKTGSEGMLGGQAVDVAMEGKQMDEETLDFVYRLKTGALLEGSLMAGAACAGADENVIRTLEKIGAKIGMAFQITDDILDIQGDEALIGKPVGSDAKNHKITYATLRGTEKAQQDADEMTDEAIRLLDTLSGEKEFLRALLKSLAHRNF